MMTKNVNAGFVDAVSGKRPFLELDYYGFNLGYIFYKGEQYRYAVEIGSGLGYVYYYSESVRINDELYDPDYGGDRFYYAEPQLKALMKINDWIHLAFGAGYRIAFGAEYSHQNETIGNSDLSAISAKISVIFGTLK
jgi:hypothetical protein